PRHVHARHLLSFPTRRSSDLWSLRKGDNKMAFQFKLPDIGEGIAEGEIVKWMVKPGDTINEDDTLLEVQNDKSVEEIPSPVTGTVKNILVDEGTVANVGDTLVEIDAPGYEDEGSNDSNESDSRSEEHTSELQSR